MLRFLTAGESHGRQITAIIEGFPAGLKVDPERLNLQLSRRQAGFGRGQRMQIENDRADISSGLRQGTTIGSPITITIHNNDWSNWERIMDPIRPVPSDLSLREQELISKTTRPRPGHADLAGGIKYGHKDLRNVLERASARETAVRTAVGALCAQLVEQVGIRIFSHVVRIGEAVTGPTRFDNIEGLVADAERSQVRCADSAVSEQMIEAIKTARKNRDSLGGIAEVIATGVPVGLGSYTHWDKRLESRIAAAVLSVPSVKGCEFGMGFAAAERVGSQVHDEIQYDPDTSSHAKGFRRTTNNAGGIEGGVSNGEPIVLRVAAKPISTLNRPLGTVDVESKESAEALVERADHCVVPAVGVVCEAVVACVLADVCLEKFGADTVEDMVSAYRTFVNKKY